MVLKGNRENHSDIENFVGENIAKYLKKFHAVLSPCWICEKFDGEDAILESLLHNL